MNRKMYPELYGDGFMDEVKESPSVVSVLPLWILFPPTRECGNGGSLSTNRFQEYMV